MDIEWKAPPPTVLATRGRRTRYADLADALLAREGEWAVMPDSTGKRTAKSAQAAAQNIRRGQVKAMPRGHFDAIADGTTVYVRAVPVAERPPDESDVIDAEIVDDDDGDGSSVPARRGDTTPASVKVREWARSAGYDVPDKGRLSGAIWDAYAAAVKDGETGIGLRAVPDE